MERSAANSNAQGPRLGPLQREVLDYVWEHSGCTVRACRDHIEAGTGKAYAYTTIQTVFDTLHRKRLLSRRRTKNAFHYTAVRSRESLFSQALKDLLTRFGTSIEPVASCLVEALEEAEPGELEALIAELKSRGLV
jgi:predicted transcriptional regulator